MNADELKSLQAPLKTQYREHPETALVTLHAQGCLGENVTCKIETGKARVEAGLHPATGGNGSSACSADMLLEALVGCAGVTLSAVATALGIALRDATIRAEGDLDFRGTLGVSKDVPVGLQADSPKLRFGYRRHGRAAGHIDSSDRTLLRRLPNVESPCRDHGFASGC